MTKMDKGGTHSNLLSRGPAPRLSRFWGGCALVHFVISVNDLPKDFVQMTEMDRVESQQNLLSRGDPRVPQDLGVYIP